MSETLTPYDPAEDLLSDEAMAAFVTDAFETGDPGYIAYALDVVARAKGMIHTARHAGLACEPVDRLPGEPSNPTLRSLLAVLDALGLDVTVTTRAAA